MSSSLKTYLFSIGKFKLYKVNKEAHRFTNELQEQSLAYHEENYLFGQELNTERLALIEKAFDKLGKKCKQMLRLFYYRGFDLDEIKTEMSLANKDTVKSQKSRCISHLKKLVNT